MAIDVRNPTPEYRAFWSEYHLCTLTTPRPDGTPHVVPVGVTFDPEQGVARVICSGTSRKAVHVAAAGAAGARVAVCQMAGRKWATLEGVARLRTEPAEVADAERRYTERYGRTPRENPARVVIEITVTRGMGNA
ncbi:TIGR03618 family F420-dependent PPOX class oxidoreductase [Streptomyces sp. NPDC091272]|uniref:TIGR03618 family F420-dependent PPOX class oxidoreductase n=1 Tax=Streptomyces sp. NPDC091272 TaxID=3365981 RepID=UPI0037F761DA